MRNPLALPPSFSQAYQDNYHLRSFVQLPNKLLISSSQNVEASAYPVVYFYFKMQFCSNYAEQAKQDLLSIKFPLNNNYFDIKSQNYN